MPNDREVTTAATTHVHTLKDVVDAYQGDDYLIKDGKLVKLFVWNDSDRYIPNSNGNLLLYREHLDGPLIGIDEARELFPEEFI